jgi:hypothetical protein
VALAKRMKMGRMSSMRYSCSYAKKSTSTPEGEDRRASTKNLLARPASTGDMAWDEFSSASSPVESRLCKAQLIGPHRWGVTTRWGWCEWDCFSLGSDAKGVIKKKGGVVVVGCAIGRMHTQIECRRRRPVGP